MQIEKECEPYLKSQEVINIVQSGNETFINRVLNCINKYKKLICSNILLTHKFLETDILKMCSENAFQDTQIVFLKKVKEKKFDPDFDTCIPFLKIIFKNIYWNEFRKELRRKMAIKKIGNRTSETDHYFEEATKSIKESLNKIVSTFSAQDKEIYNLYYEQGFKLKEIANILALQYQTVRDRASKICRAVVNNWKF